jgi:hypothetical protein
LINDEAIRYTFLKGRDLCLYQEPYPKQII